MRQSGHYRKAARLLSEGRTGEGFAELDKLGWIQAVPDAERYQALAGAWPAKNRPRIVDESGWEVCQFSSVARGTFLGRRPLVPCPRCTTRVKDPSGLVPLVNKIGWLREASAKTTDPHVLVTWVKKIGGHAQAGESHSPSGRAGRGLDAHFVSVVASQPHSPSGQAGRGLDAHFVSVVASQPRSPAGQAGRGFARDLCSQSLRRCPGLGEPRPVGAGMGCTAEQNRNVTTTSTRSNSAQATPGPTCRRSGKGSGTGTTKPLWWQAPPTWKPRASPALAGTV